MILKRQILMILGLMLMVAGSQAVAAADMSKLYVGGGISQNDADGFPDSATGFQIQAGYELDFSMENKIHFAIEGGYMTSGDFDINTPFGTFSESADGVWITPIASYGFNQRFEGLARLGFDLGDDDGLMFGIGGHYNITTQWAARLEYVLRDNIDSLQLNVLYSFK